MTCPPNVSVTANPNQCSANVNLGTATATDGCDGPVPAVGGRSDGQPLTAPFPIGRTIVTYVATDSSGNIGRCVQNVDVSAAGTGIAAATGHALDDNAQDGQGRRREEGEKAQGKGHLYAYKYRLCAQYFHLRGHQASDGSRPVSARQTIRSSSRSLAQTRTGTRRAKTCSAELRPSIPGPANKRTFVIEFNATIPPLAGETSNLDTEEVLPDNFTSVLTFVGSSQTLTINARVQERVKLIDPANPQGDSGGVTLCRSGDEFIVRYSIYDSRTSDVRSARYEFLDSSDRVVRTVDGVDLAGPVGQRNLVNGQSFSVEQRFTGADDNEEVVRVRVTVSGSNSSASAVSSRINQNCNGSFVTTVRVAF